MATDHILARALAAHNTPGRAAYDAPHNPDAQLRLKPCPATSWLARTAPRRTRTVVPCRRPARGRGRGHGHSRCRGRARWGVGVGHRSARNAVKGAKLVRRRRGERGAGGGCRLGQVRCGRAVGCTCLRLRLRGRTDGTRHAPHCGKRSFSRWAPPGAAGYADASTVIRGRKGPFCVASPVTLSVWGSVLGSLPSPTIPPFKSFYS